MKELLIVRSVSFQQLDLNLPEIKRQFPDASISLLTHQHGVKLAEKYEAIQTIYVYPYKDGYSFSQRVKEFENKTFDVLLLPVTNITGAGFGNVLTFGLTIKAKEKYIVNVVSDIKKISDGKIIADSLLRVFYKVVSFILAIVFSIFFMLFLPFRLLFKTKL